ncbi:MAG: hypothetical protein ACO38V_06475 [Phycisphaerales bacterium]|jgi:hypothetical protein
MLKSALQNTILVAGLLIGAVLLGLSVGSLASLRGVPGPTILSSVSPVSAVATILILLVPTTLIAIVVGRMLNAVVGLFVLGAALATLSMQCGTIEDLAFGGGSLRATAIESVGWAVLVGALAVIVLVGSGPLPDVPRRKDTWLAEFLDSGSAVFLAVGLVALPVAWLVVATPLKGQAIGGTILASAAVGFVGRLVAPRLQPALLFAMPVLAGAAGTLVASFSLSGELADAFVSGSLSRLAYPMPIDWAAGALCGVAIGLGWARGFVKVEAPSEPAMRRAIRG